MIILNDIHLGVNRRAGTTPATSKALKDKLQSQLASLVDPLSDEHLVIAGDLFDQFEVEYTDVIQVYSLLAEFLHRYGMLTLIRGNHDASAKGDRISSFQFLAQILESQFDDKVQVINGFLCPINDDIWAIGHCDNQDLFDIEMQRAIDTMPKGSNLILHCNYDNKFAEESDHSLNLSPEQAKKLADAEIDIMLAHEHQARHVKNVWVLGNQWPSSVADCMGNDKKYAHRVHDGVIDMIETWDAATDFVRVDWRKLFDDEIPDTVSFIRVEGDASASEAADVISAIAKFRSRRNTLVVSNAVRVDGVDQMEELASLSFDTIKSFDVLAELMGLLEEKERDVIQRLLKDSQ